MVQFMYEDRVISSKKHLTPLPFKSLSALMKKYEENFPEFIASFTNSYSDTPKIIPSVHGMKFCLLELLGGKQYLVEIRGSEEKPHEFVMDWIGYEGFRERVKALRLEKGYIKKFVLAVDKRAELDKPRGQRRLYLSQSQD
ncbi:hypothetical protein M422DRAFT_54298 [Sphaerobolus stellatus SS14]|uniref:Uncharacterized protein n=1 Tax=Sphaerobolus stellatus (strain SS14) TaxID=990650 RepID=A0A0C9UV31_SPHS4|nr:hypothetical protein M422DRAFT_54298 [Sphaerobolus stellatus SS14]